MSEKGEQKNGITRRNFLRLAAGALGAYILSKNNFAFPRLEFSGATDHKEQKIYPERQIGNLHLTIIASEHDEKDWQAHKEEILAAISDIPVIIPEYFPEEYQELRDSFLYSAALSDYDRANALFVHLQEYCLSQQKELWVVDPAYSQAAIAYRLINNAPYVGVAGIVASEFIPREIDVIFDSLINENLERAAKEKAEVIPTLEEEQKKTMKLRQFLKHVFGKAVPALLGGMALGFDKNPDEMDMRHVLIAEALEKLGAIVPPGTRAALIYPQAHCLSIINYLDSSEVRERRAHSYHDEFSNSPFFQDMLKIRHYKAGRGTWTTLPGLEE